MKVDAAAVTYLQDNLLLNMLNTYTLRKEVIVNPLVPYHIYA